MYRNSVDGLSVELTHPTPSFLSFSDSPPQSPSLPESRRNFHNSPLSSRQVEGSPHMPGANRSTRSLSHSNMSSGATSSAMGASIEQPTGTPMQSAADLLLSAPPSAYTPHTEYAMDSPPYAVSSSGLPEGQNQQADHKGQEEKPVRITAGRLLGGITMAVAGGIGAAMAFNNLNESEIDWSHPQAKELAITAGGFFGVLSACISPFFVVSEARVCFGRCCGVFCQMLENCN